MQNVTKNLIACLVGSLFALLLLEIGLHIFNPFGFRLKGDQITLPHSMVRVIENKINPALDPVIQHTKNSLGFRGPEPPLSSPSVLSILTIGGSTTECFYISDGKTWSDVLDRILSRSLPGLWLNNAGLDGMSTVGHIRLMEQIVPRIRPRIALFLVGVNDIRINDIRRSYDSSPLLGESTTWLNWLTRRSDIANTLLNLKRYHEAKRHGLVTIPTAFAHDNPFTEAAKAPPLDSQSLKILRAAFTLGEQDGIEAYQGRIRKIIQLCRNIGCLPVFLTQPSLYSCQNDPNCGGNVASIMLDGYPLLLWGERLKKYNEALRETCAAENVFVIDMESLLPRSAYVYYDFVHYNNAGCTIFGEIVASKLLSYIQSHPSLVSRPQTKQPPAEPGEF